jgi:hypothetical protein
MFTLWDSLEAVKAFAGAEYATAVFYPEDERFLISPDPTTTPLSRRDRDPSIPRQNAASCPGMS